MVKNPSKEKENGQLTIYCSPAATSSTRLLLIQEIGEGYVRKVTKEVSRNLFAFSCHDIQGYYTCTIHMAFINSKGGGSCLLIHLLQGKWIHLADTCLSLPCNIMEGAGP